jgi:folate-binding protein YgfZ
MLGRVATDDPILALRSGHGFVDLSFWRKVDVSGPDACRWLNDLVSVDISDLEPERARRSLLLSPTGRIRAEFTLARFDDAFLLLQDPGQSVAIDVLLAPYVLSSDVEVRDRTEELALFAFPGRADVARPPGTKLSIPSCAGRGTDLIAAAEARDSTLRSLAEASVLVGNEDLERWRAVVGLPRFGVDASEDDLPSEGGFDDAVSYGKGCYLGQEAVARVRNLGHPRRAVVHVTAGGPISSGQPVEVDGVDVGRITSAAEHDGRWWALAKVRWDARGSPLTVAGGLALSPVDPD